MRVPIVLLTCLVLEGLIALSAHSTDPAGSEYDILRALVPPTIDGNLDDSIWRLAKPAMLTITNEGKDVPPEIQTAAYCLYDDENLYVAYHCFEPNPKKLKVLVQARDGNPIWEDDEIEYFIDPEHDHTAPYVQFIVNAGNAQFDNKRGGGGVAWNADWESAVSVGQTKDYFVELRIPFEALEVEPPQPGDVWGMNFTRHVMTVPGTPWTTWSDTGPSFHTPGRFGDVTFQEEALSVGPLGKVSVIWGALKAGR